MLPEAKSEDLLYVSADNSVNVYAYRSQLHKQVGTLTGFGLPRGQCVDAAGDVWITDEQHDDIVEYAHGGTTPLKTLSTYYTGGQPAGCSVSSSGDLAVSIRLAILLFKNGSAPPMSYANPDCAYPSIPGYDNKGNLYVEAVETISSYSYKHVVCELRAGSDSLRRVSFNRRILDEAGVMWDGKHITLADVDKRYNSQTISEIFQTTESPSGNLTSIRVTRLFYSGCENDNTQFFIVGKKNTPVNNQLGTAILSSQDSPYCQQVYSWHYPAGGTQQWSLSVKYPSGSSVSLAND